MASQRQQAVRPALSISSSLAQNPLHRILSRENSLTSTGDSPVPQPDEAVLRPEDEREKAELDRDEERRSIFQKQSNDILDVPSGYRKVEVLIIRWDESIDDFKGHNNEIERLQTVFRTGYGFNCRVAAIKNDRDPQTELDWQILSHIREHDDEDSLLIVYYTGHGNQVFEEDNQRRLELTATQTLDVKTGCHMPSAYWDSAEAPLRNRAKGDVLAILDCCFASTAALKSRSPEARTYQMLAASSVDGATCGPGATSFTTALCDSLEELLKDPSGASFPVLKLLEQINIRRPAQPALLWDRLRHHNERSVMLGRLDLNPAREASFEKEEPEKASLVLRLSLKVADLENEQIEDLARALPVVCHNAGVQVRKMEWMKMRRRDPNRVLQKAIDAFCSTRSTSSPAIFQEANTIVDRGESNPSVPGPFRQKPSKTHRRVEWAGSKHSIAEDCYGTHNGCKLVQACENNDRPSIYSSKALMIVCLLMAIPYTIEDRVKMVLLAICIALVLTRGPGTVQELDKCLGCRNSAMDEKKRSRLYRLSTW